MQLELFNVATHYPFELSEEFSWGWKSQEEYDNNSGLDLDEYYHEVPKHLTDWSK